MDLKSPPAHRPTLYGMHHMIVSGHPLATHAGMMILERGGNAFDAGVATGFALNVVQPDMANLGGVAPIMLYVASTKSVTTISGVGRWPRSIDLEKLRRVGNGRIPFDQRRWVTPAAVDAWLTTLERYGTMSVNDILGPAIELAANGFPTNYFIHHNLTVARERMTQWPHSREVFFPRGAVPAIGTPIIQTALADTLKSLVDAERSATGSREAGVRAARDHFYKGDIAEQVGRFAHDVGAFLQADDLRSFAVKEEPPAMTRYRDHDVYSCGPWSQGPATLQALNILSGYPFETLSDAEATHLTIEAVNAALLDRNRWYGDPDIIDVPLDRLLSTNHASEQRSGIEMDRATPSRQPDRPGNASPDTTYVCVVDGAGNAFSATPSDSTILHTPMVPGLGFAPSDRGLQASLDPANPNAVAPGKRPRLTPNPGLVVGPDSVMPYGTPGGDVQTQAMVQVLLNILVRGDELQTAVERPRWASYGVPLTEDPHPFTPNLVRLEQTLYEGVGSDLTRKGHLIEHWPDLCALAGGVCLIRRDNRTRVLAGGADPRRMSYGMAW